MKKILKLFRNTPDRSAKAYFTSVKYATTIKEKRISHTISYAVSFNDTWEHIRNEIKKL